MLTAAEIRANFPLFAGISGAEWPAFAQQIRLRAARFARDELIFRAGSAATQLGLVAQGRVQVEQTDYWGRSGLMAVLQPGDMFGEAFAVSGTALTVSVRALDAAEVLLADVAPLLGGAGDSPALATARRNLLAVLARKNLALAMRLEHMGQRRLREKLLSYFSRQASLAGGQAFCLPLNRQQLADYLAVDRSALCRELARMQRDGLMTLRGRRVTLHAGNLTEGL